MPPIDRIQLLYILFISKDDADGGYWELNQKLGSHLNVDYEACNKILLNAGIKSLGM